MAKFIIIDNMGNIIRTINLPYEGTLIDISDMPDAEWEGWCYKAHDFKVEMNAKSEYKKDVRGLPKIIRKVNEV